MILPKLTRQKIHAAGSQPVEIVWPTEADAPAKGSSYTVQTSADKAGEWKIEVLDTRELPDGSWRATVRPEPEPIRLLGKAGGYVTSSQGAINTRKAAEPASLNGPQFRAEVEPEAVDARFQRRLSDEAAFVNLRRQGDQREIAAKLRSEEKVAAERRRANTSGANAAQRRVERSERRLAAAA